MIIVVGALKPEEQRVMGLSRMHLKLLCLTCTYLTLHAFYLRYANAGTGRSHAKVEPAAWPGS